MRWIAVHFIRLIGLMALVLWLALAGARADYQAGLAAFDAGNYEKAAKEWQAAAETGDAKAQHGLGLLYDSGRGVAQDFQLAAKWYGKAADQGLPPAASNLALLYALGRGVDRNMTRAAQLWTLAAEAGDATAQFNLGLLYYRGSGVAKNYRTAATWLLKSAQNGSEDGQYAIAEMYRLGRGVPKDVTKARHWFSEAAKSGNQAAIDRLAELGPGPSSETSAATTAGLSSGPEKTAHEPTSAQSGKATMPLASAVSADDALGSNAKPPTPKLTGTITQQLGPAQIEPPPVPPAPAEPVIQAPSAVPAGGSTKTFPALVSTSVAATGNDTLAGPAPLESMPSSQVIALLGANSAASKSADSGPISLGLPLMGVPTASSTQSPETGVPAPAKAKALIWIGTLKSDYEARMYWAQQVQRFPDLLKTLTLDLRPVDLGGAQGIWFKVTGGPFAGTEAAEKFCQAIKSRSPADECTVILD